MTGLWRSAKGSPDKISRLEMAHCQSPPEYNRMDLAGNACYKHNWWRSFDHKGWSTCRNGFFMKGLYRTSGQYLRNIESAKCCRPRGAVKHWGQCYNQNVWHSFDKKGWSKCKAGYYMAGLYRSSCNQLYCLEEFKCCKLAVFSPPLVNANWWSSFDHKGWSQCGRNQYMVGMWRNDRGRPDKILRLEMAKCQGAPGYSTLRSVDQWCYSHNWRKSFDHKGWSTCQNGYYMRGLFRTSGQYLRNIESAKCCRPVGLKKRWGSCYNKNVWRSFDKKGWSICKKGYYMAGLYRSSCDQLLCLEEFKCCKMSLS